MSHRHHPAVSNEVSHIIAELNQLKPYKVHSLYNVEVWEDGQVHDLTEGEMYPSITDWANHYVDADTSGYDDLIPDKYADLEDEGYYY